jgi:hypothetical protein
MGAAHDPQQAPPRTRAAAVAFCHLSLPRSAPPDPTETEATTKRELQALGAITRDGAVAGRRHGKRQAHRRHRGLGLTSIDDHSRFCVIAKVVIRATARPVCSALLGALNTFGIPEQILTDNGKVFTGRLGNRSANVLFDRKSV